MASVSVLNSIGTVVHNAPDKAVSVLSSFGTVVHDTPPTLDTVSVLSSFGTVVHDTPPPLQAVSVQSMLGTVIHDSTFVFNVSDITGMVGSPATFDASTQGFPVADYAHEWSWTSVPGGSSYANQSIPFPDNGVNTYFNMTDNQGLWHFEGNADDSSGAGNNGTVSGASLVAGKVGAEAYSFDGINNNIDVGSAFAYTTEDFSLAFWVQEGASQSGFVNIFGNQSSQRGFCLENDSSGGHSYRIVAGDGGWTFGTSTALTPGVWTHLAITRNGSTVKIFKDGSLIVTDTGFPVAFSAATIPMWLGGNQASGRYWQGILDEFAIWDRTLSSDEIYDLYFLQFGSAASGSAPGTNLDDEFTFTPDVEGTYTINLNFYQYNNGQSADGDVDAVISPSGGSIITGSNPTVNLVEASSTGYVLNTYRIQNLSVQRSRTTEQVPFKLGTKGRQSLRLDTNTEFTGSS